MAVGLGLAGARVLRQVSRGTRNQSRHRKSQVRELAFPNHAHVAINLALDLVLKHPGGFRKLPNNFEDLSAVGKLAQLGAEAHLLADREFMCLHLSTHPPRSSPDLVGLSAELNGQPLRLCQVSIER